MFTLVSGYLWLVPELGSVLDKLHSILLTARQICEAKVKHRLPIQLALVAMVNMRYRVGKRETESHREGELRGEREGERWRERDRESERDRQRGRALERERERERERE